MAGAAEALFDVLRGFKQPDPSGRSPQQRLLDYCTQILGSIEHPHIDFKEKSDRTNAILSSEDQEHLAKATSGFANSGGGVLLWGVEDKTMVPKPISNVQTFAATLLSLTPRITDPIVTGIDGDWIPSDSGTPPDGFALIYIPESPLPPHRVLLNRKGIQNHYYIRSGEDLIVAPHVQLEDMFGRRPRPKLKLSWRIIPASRTDSTRNLRIIVGIENEGRGVAKSPFLSIAVNDPYRIAPYGPGGTDQFGLKRYIPSMVSQETMYGGSVTTVIYPGIRHDVSCLEAVIDLSRRGVGIAGLVIHYRLAAEGIVPTDGVETIRSSELWKAAIQ